MSTTHCSSRGILLFVSSATCLLVASYFLVPPFSRHFDTGAESVLISDARHAGKRSPERPPLCSDDVNALAPAHALLGPPPRDIPAELTLAYTMNGRAQLAHTYYDDSAWGTAAPAPVHYSRSEIEGMMASATRGESRSYTETDAAMFTLFERYPNLVRGKRVVVMGSVMPWYEAMMLAFGAQHVLVVEYGARSSDHPQMKFGTPRGVANCSLDYEVGVSISSFEHDGLGRYGDPLAPDADLNAMRHMKQLIAPGALLLFAVPIGKDAIVWNAHRVYGEHRWRLMTEGWEVVDYAGVTHDMWSREHSNHAQPAWILRNTP